MTDEELQKLTEIFQVVFDVPSDQDVSSISRLGTENWDSLAHVSLVSAIESVFEINLNSEHRNALNSFKAAQLILFEVSIS